MKKELSYLRKGDQTTYPLIDIELIGPERSLVVKALVDSGSTYSTFRSEIAEYLAIPTKVESVFSFRG